MKLKNFLRAICILFCACSAAWAQQAEVISFNGKVEYEQAGQWITVNAGDMLDTGTVISTGFRSTAVLKIGESRFTVAPLTRIAIEKLSENEGNYETSMYVSAGKLTLDVKPVEGRKVGFTARSPVATASVRGTSGIFRADGMLSAHTGVFEYSSSSSSARTQPVAAGQQASCSISGGVVAPQTMAAQQAGGTTGTTVTLAAKESIPAAGAVVPGPAVSSAEESRSSGTGSVTVSVTIQ